LIEQEYLGIKKVDRFSRFGDDQDEIDEEEQWDKAMTYEEFLESEKLIEKRTDYEEDDI
jgi:hypothetical protein